MSQPWTGGRECIPAHFPTSVVGFRLGGRGVAVLRVGGSRGAQGGGATRRRQTSGPGRVQHCVGLQSWGQAARDGGNARPAGGLRERREKRADVRQTQGGAREVFGALLHPRLLRCAAGGDRLPPLPGRRPRDTPSVTPLVLTLLARAGSADRRAPFHSKRRGAGHAGLPRTAARSLPRPRGGPPL